MENCCAMTESSRFHIVPVGNARQLETFIRMPWPIYREDPAWVPPLIYERKEHLSEKNPFFQHARWQAWLAMDEDRPVGRISAQIDQLHLERYDDKCGYFGMLEAIDNPAVFSLLLNTAEQWLREQGMALIRGPFNLSINEECGLLVEGFDTPPSLMMGHARPYYGPHVEGQSYSVVKQLLAYRIYASEQPPEIMQKLARKTGRAATTRPLRRKEIDKELEIMQDIFNDAWSNNWGFVPFTAAEFKEVGRNLLMLVSDDFVQIAEIDGEPVAMMVALPNVNEAIKDLDGRLFPTGFLKLLWRLKVKYPRSGRIPLMGVRKRYHHTPLGPGLAYLMISAIRDAVLNRGIQEMEMSWILEDNAGMRHILETAGAEIYKRYNIYQKSL